MKDHETEVIKCECKGCEFYSVSKDGCLLPRLEIQDGECAYYHFLGESSYAD